MMVQQCFFIAEKQQKTILNFSLNSLQQNNINMEHHKILNLLNEANNSKFVTRKWNTANDNSKADYSVRNEIIYNTKVLKSNFCGYNNAYILVGGDIAITGDNGNFISFKLKAKLLQNTAADSANGTLRNATIAVPLKYFGDLK